MSLIISRLRIPIVTIVTESAFFVTIIVTESGPILKSLHQGGLNNSGKREKRLVFRSPEMWQDCVTSFTREMSICNL